MKEYDLRSKGVGAYEFPPAGDSDRRARYDFICLKEISFSGPIIEFRLTYTKDDKQVCKADFIFEKTFSFNSVTKVIGTAKAEYGESSALANMIRCAEIESNWGDSPRSALAMETLMSYGKENLTNPKDVDTSQDMYLLKAMVAHFISGRLYLRPQTTVSKIAQGDRATKYIFYFVTDELKPLTIAAKIVSRSPGDYLEVISTEDAVYRYLL